MTQNKMTENIKIVRECRMLETDLNVPPVDDDLYVRTLRNRNSPYDIRNRQIDSQNNRIRNPISLLGRTV